MAKVTKIELVGTVTITNDRGEKWIIAQEIERGIFILTGYNETYCEFNSLEHAITFIKKIIKDDYHYNRLQEIERVKQQTKITDQ